MAAAQAAGAARSHGGLPCLGRWSLRFLARAGASAVFAARECELLRTFLEGALEVASKADLDTEDAVCMRRIVIRAVYQIERRISGMPSPP